MGVHLSMSKLRSYNQEKTARLHGGRISPAVLAQMKGHAEEFGLSLSDYLHIAESNFYSTEPWLTCKVCGVKNLADEDQIHAKLFTDEGCRGCGADSEKAFGI